MGLLLEHFLETGDGGIELVEFLEPLVACGLIALEFVVGAEHAVGLLEGARVGSGGIGVFLGICVEHRLIGLCLFLADVLAVAESEHLTFGAVKGCFCRSCLNGSVDALDAFGKCVGTFGRFFGRYLCKRAVEFAKGKDVGE